MLDSWVRECLAQTAWASGLLTLLQERCRAVFKRLREIRQNLLIALCLWALGFLMVAIGLVAFAAMLLAVWWREYPWQSLLGLSILYAGGGVWFIWNSIRRMS